MRLFRYMATGVLLLLAPALSSSIHAATVFPHSPIQGEAKGGSQVIYVATDIHVMDSSLVINEGEALNQYLGQDRKMLRQSVEAFEAIIDSAISHHANALLLCGDLTKDGEKISHLRVTRSLERARQAGVTPFVIPGNHDIRNPYARYFDGNKTSPAEGVTANKFADIYRDFGYSDTDKRDSCSLSYVCEPVPGLTLICIDASQYEKNTSVAHGDDKDVSEEGGFISQATLQWILNQADEAKAQGKQVIAMMHQQLADHLDGVSGVLTTAAIENGDSVAQQLMQHGIHVVFTGHMHYSDAVTVWNDTHDNSVIDITTGSTITYPSHYRVVTVKDDGSCISVDTHRLTAIPSQPDYQAYGREFQEKGMEPLTRSLSHLYWNVIDSVLNTYCKKVNLGVASITFNLPKTANEFAVMAYKYLGTFATHAWLAVYEGNEYEQGAYDTYIKELRHGVYGFLGEIIDNDIYWLGKPVGRRNARDYVMEEIEPIIRSLLDDLTQIGTPNEDRTDDLHLNIDLRSGRLLTDAEFSSGIEEILPPLAYNDDNGTGGRHIPQVRIYNMQGQLVGHQLDKLPAGCYIVSDGKKVRKTVWAAGNKGYAAPCFGNQ